MFKKIEKHSRLNIYRYHDIIERENEKERGKLQSEDSKSRQKITSKIEEYMKNGMSQEQAVDLIIQDKELVNQFRVI